MKAYFIIWQDPETRRWYPVGKLLLLNELFAFIYTEGSTISENFKSFANMNKKDAVYISNKLFPVFSVRVMNPNRPDFLKYSHWSGLDEMPADPLSLMAIMGGARATDMLQVYPVPCKTEQGNYETTFFCHGISHLPTSSQDRVLDLVEGDLLYPLLDPQNPFDVEAVALRTEDPTSLIGYCPRHMCFDIRDLVNTFRQRVDIRVKRINREAPAAFKMLVEATSKWPSGFSPCDRKVYEPLVDYRSVLSKHFRLEEIA